LAVVLLCSSSSFAAATAAVVLQVAFVAGVADSSGYGWAICKALAEAGATVTVGTWPPVLGIFQKSLQKGSFKDDSELSDGSFMEIAKVSLGFRVCVYYDCMHNIMLVKVSTDITRM
jgi:hypothetical protein